MYYLKVITDFAAAHALRGYEGKCARLHGHNFKIEVVVRGPRLDELGMLVDFVVLKARVKRLLEGLDHRNLNDLPAFSEVNPTAENIARLLYDGVAGELPEAVSIHSVTVYETDRACATYMSESV